MLFLWKMQFLTAKICVFREKAVPLHPNLVKQYTFDTKKTAKRPRWWCKKTRCLTKIISQIQIQPQRYEK